MDKKKVFIVLLSFLIVVSLVVFFLSSRDKDPVVPPEEPVGVVDDNDDYDPFDIPTDQIPVNPDFQIEITPAPEPSAEDSAGGEDPGTEE